MKYFKVFLQVSIIHLPLLTASQRQEMVMPNEPGLQPNVETLTSSRKIPTLGRNGRWKRSLRTRKLSCMKWCASKMKAKEIDEVDWIKIIAGTILVLGLVHIAYFYHPVCRTYRD